MDADKEKVSELKAMHVDVKNQLSDLISYSSSSSGVISGLRGTGKTHLMLLARHEINENCFTGKANGVFCVYLNVKRLTMPEKFDQELFNRVFSVFLYNEISKQLINILEQFKEVVRNGNSEFSELSIGTSNITNELHDLIELAETLHTKLNLTGSELSADWSAKYLEETKEQLTKNNTYLSFLNTNTIREELMSLMKLLNLKGMVLYIDEWEKISYNCELQRFLSFYIDRILDNPIYCWISIVPYRGSLYHLDRGADLQHLIDLDENLIFENSSKDRELCLNYFKEFVNKRLAYYFDISKIDVSLMFNNNKNFEKLVLASMGNSRDFGTMLLKCWSEFRAYRTSQLSPGRPYQYISADMVISAIKNNGEKKISNINNNPSILKTWNDLETFCISKKSSHLAIEEKRVNIDAISMPEFSDLIYHRLLHLRKKHVPAKETSIESKLSIYALNYSSIYDLHSSQKKIQFITDYDTIHNRVRRYIYNPTTIINHIKIQSGEIFPCVSCGENISITKMTAAWNNNACPYCGGKIRVE